MAVVGKTIITDCDRHFAYDQHVNIYDREDGVITGEMYRVRNCIAWHYYMGQYSNVSVCKTIKEAKERFEQWQTEIASSGTQPIF